MAKGLTKRLMHLLGKAVHEWRMIDDNERILVGVSGGKDSLSLFHLLVSLKKKAPVPFELVPVYIDPGFDNSFVQKLGSYINERYKGAHQGMVVEKTDYGAVAHSDENKANPCFLCSRLRRKRLFELAREHDCKKLALGHNKDDLIETLFINIFYAGKIGTMKPRQSFFSGRFDIIRPLSYVEKHQINSFAKVCELPQFVNRCPSAGQTKRQDIADMLERMYQQNEHIKGNIFRAMGNIATDYLLEMP
ncbi:MAG: tRNA 2-thiocytidine(32) synthetase TtcA [Desulfobacter postgatei]|uniref:tRNA 2-thiocytidine(32) synthetase TtcA n=1 Tax=Desulfobacter postgatei TaxID=2293 RepID=A0A2G6MQK6_9BACT|nr:MAG: tRNA 2-thiocytidine(32) synthetase TtcA [Desulfobacter postgatei]